MPGSYIDDIAKDNLERFQPEYDPADWKAMDAMLESNKTAGMFSNVRRLLMAAAAILLFITGGLIGYFIDKSSGPDTILTPSNPAYTIENNEGSGIENNQNNSNNEAVFDEEDNVIDNENINNNVPPVNAEKVAVNKSNSEHSKTVVLINEGIKENRLFYQNVDPNEAVTFFDMTKDVLPDMMPFKELARNLDELPETDFGQQLKDLKKKKRIQGSIGFMMSPDLNIPDKSSGGYTAGVTGEVALSKKVSISTGVLFSKKKYKDNSTLKATATFIPEATAATFHLIEVPLNVRYNITTDNRTTPFISAGVSGYFPVKETYEIECLVATYDPIGSNYQQPLAETTSNISYGAVGIIDRNQVEYLQTDRTINNYQLKPYLGFLNLSAGLDYRLSPAISLQVAPQVKLPMTGMGIEEKMVTTVSLNSSIRYHFGN